VAWTTNFSSSSLFSIKLMQSCLVIRGSFLFLAEITDKSLKCVYTLSMYVLSNAFLKVTISPDGAEIHSLKDTKTEQELLWQGDAQFWNRRAPLLFPLIGSSKDGLSEFKQKSYPLRKHGFARDLRFELLNESDISLQFSLSDSPETYKEYPFHFSLEVRYHLQDNRLNTGIFLSSDEDLDFVWGGHPGFLCPVFPQETQKDYELEFETDEDAGIWRINSQGLVLPETEASPVKSRKLPLTPQLFDKDVLIWQKPKSRWVELHNAALTHRVRMGLEGFEAFGLWSKPQAPFVCLEPWAGMPAKADGSRSLLHLAKGQVYFSEFWTEITYKA